MYSMGMFPVSMAKEEELKAKMAALDIREADMEESFVRSGGKGGQKVNKTSTCVYLKHLPTGIEVKSKTDTVPFTPYATLKDALGVVIFLLVYAWFIFYMPNFLGHPDNYIEANALKTPAHIVPEWYYLPFYAMLRAITFNVGPIDSKLGGVLVMFGSIIILFFVPWLDWSKVRSAVYRPWYKLFFWLFVADCIMLGWLGSRTPTDLFTLMSQLGTLYYFAFFLVIMPVLGLVETPRRIPNSITEAVLEKNAKA